MPRSREYVQPQWILDSANFNFVLPVRRYGVGAALPPHLSPWVDDKEEGYVPAYKEEVERLKNGEVLDASDDEKVLKRVEDDEEEKEKKSVVEEEDSSSEEEQEEPSPANSALLKENAAEGDGSESSEEEDEEEEDDEEAGRKELKRKETEDEEAARLAKALMSKKAARLYGRMQHGIAKKQEKVDNLHKKRRDIESTREKSKEGKTVSKLKVERLKKERRETEKAYDRTGGSMKKKRRKK